MASSIHGTPVTESRFTEGEAHEAGAAFPVACVPVAGKVTTASLVAASLALAGVCLAIAGAASASIPVLGSALAVGAGAVVVKYFTHGPFPKTFVYVLRPPAKAPPVAGPSRPATAAATPVQPR